MEDERSLKNEITRTSKNRFRSCRGALLAGCATEPDALKLRTMGSLFFGGTVTHLANGETFHGDHGYAQFFIPQNARTYPLILWHGIGQS